MIQGLFSVDEVAAMIEKGDSLLLAGDSALLKTLPKGKWIAGLACRFVENGKDLVTTREKIFVHNLTGIAADAKLDIYDTSTIQSIYDDAFENGFSVMILPHKAEVTNEYAINCMNYSNFASRPLCGWVSEVSVFLEPDRDDESIVFSGETGLSYNNSAVVMHFALPPEKYAEIHTFNPFIQGSGDVIVFEENGQQVENVLINGVRQNFRQYLFDKKIDRSSFEVYNVIAGDYAGITINANISMDLDVDQEKYVSLGNPVYKGIPYRFAKLAPDQSYDNLKQIDDKIVFSLSCITNFVVPDVFLKYIKHTNGPFAYGEIAYVLLNHTTVYVTVGNSLN